MAGNSRLFLAEGQTDEDFFVKLADDDGELAAAPASQPQSDNISHSLSSLSLVDADDRRENGASTSEELRGSTKGSDPKGDGSKHTGVHEVQWSSFRADPQQPDASEFGFDTDFLTENAKESTNAQQESTGFNSDSEQPALGSTNSQFYSSANEQSMSWENQYPGWKYDYTTGQWYPVDGYDSSGNASQWGGSDAGSMSSSQNSQYNALAVSDGYVLGSSGVSYLQQTTRSVLGTIPEECTTSNVAIRNQDSQLSMQYPPNMLFDSQYPGWYFDTNTQQWYTLDSYNQSDVQNTATALQDHLGRGTDASSGFAAQQNYRSYNNAGQFEQEAAQSQGSRDLGDWSSSSSSYAQGQWNNFAQQNTLQPESLHQINQAAGFYPNQQSQSFYGSAGNVGRQMHHHVGFKMVDSVFNHGYGSNNASNGFQAFVPKESVHHFNQPKVGQNLQTCSADNVQNSVSYSQPMFHSGNGSYSQFPHASSAERSSIGRPSHALVTFGFGGKLIVMKDASTLNYGNQGIVCGTVSILNLMDIVKAKSDGSSISSDSCSYFHALCQQSFPGPLVGGNAATRDVNKWIDNRIVNCESSSMDLHKGELLKLLFCLLKISLQHCGKLRSPYDADPSVEESDGPDAAVAKLFASARKNGAQMRDYGSLIHCMKNLPSQGQIQATAIEVQNLLVSARRKEALQCAQDGHLWGPALVLAAQLGEKFYVATVKKMAHEQFISGSPLRTLCLLIAGQPADVFSADSSTNNLPGLASAYQQSTQVLSNGILDDWEENLAIITANRTTNDELVMLHLGDCLWKEKGEITAAHMCYLVAEANFDSYSNSARLCLIGADHWKRPRTFASPEAMQRTESYEYSKVLGNSQFVLLPFQPYKLIYAYMLAEVGKVSDSLRYCQASLKLLKNCGRATEVDLWKSLFSSLEERLRTHQQGGYSTNLATAKLVGKLFTSIDRSIHRMIGAPPPPLPPLPHTNVNGKESYSMAPKVASSQSTMAMLSLIPSASVEAISEWTDDSDRKNMHNRSISEPDFGRSTKQALSKDSGSPHSQSKESISGVPSRFGRFGSQLLQKTMGWVSKSRSNHQAKLGERNRFYYDEKLKRWVEEGAELPTGEAVLPPPPTTASFQNGTTDYDINNAFKGKNSADGGLETKSMATSEHHTGTPPIPPSTNHSLARPRMGVRSRYVDTFNKGGGSLAPSFLSPSVASVKPSVPAKFFIPTAPLASEEQSVDEPREQIPQAVTAVETSNSITKEPLFTSPSTSSSMQRYPSMGNIISMGNQKVGTMLQNTNGSLSSHTRAASWSGAHMDTINPSGDGIGGGPYPFISYNPSQLKTHNSPLQLNGGCLGDDLHEVEL